MSLELFAGFIVGNVIVVIAAVLGYRGARRRSNEVESDERTVMIQLRTGTTAFYLTGGLVYLGWIIENLLRYSNGETIRLFTPLGILGVVMMLVWLGAYSYHYRKLSLDGEPTEEERKKLRGVGLGVLAIAMSMTPITLSTARRAGLELQITLGVLQVVLLVMAVVLLVMARDKKAA